MVTYILRSRSPRFHGPVILFSGERMCTILVNRLEDWACPVNVWLGKLTALDMTPLGWLGRKTSTQTKTSDFALYLEYYLLDKCHTWDTSMWPNEWPLTISRSLWPIFHGSVILPYILNTFCWINVTPGILVPCDPIIDVKIYLCWCDLYFMVQWFCLISWILFVG